MDSKTHDNDSFDHDTDVILEHASVGRTRGIPPPSPSGLRLLDDVFLLRPNAIDELILAALQVIDEPDRAGSAQRGGRGTIKGRRSSVEHRRMT